MNVRQDEALNSLGTAPDELTEIADQKSLNLESKILELEASNHRLRVDNLSLRAKYDALKSKRSFERRAIFIFGMAIWLMFVFAAISKIFKIANLAY